MSNVNGEVARRKENRMPAPLMTQADFRAVGGEATAKPFRFVWQINDQQLRDVNNACGMHAGDSRHRGFLTRWLGVWLALPKEKRPPLEVPRTLNEDLLYIPSPCYVFANSDDRRQWRCWYSVISDVAPIELMNNRMGMLLFAVEGSTDEANAMIEVQLRRFRFEARVSAMGFTFYRNW